MSKRKILVFQTDFTYQEAAVAAMYGVVKTVDSSIEIIDATHQIPKFDIWSASYRLYQYLEYWPKGTIFVSVVDPGVGTERKASVAKTKTGYYIVTPDNGTLTHIEKYHGIEEIREIDETKNRLTGHKRDAVSIFHGRDLFSFTAARLAAGKITFNEVGPAYSNDEIIRLPLLQANYKNQSVEGIIEIADPNFGNQWTNIDTETFIDQGFTYGDKIITRIYHNSKLVFKEELSFVSSFADVEKDATMIYNNELMKLGFAVNQGSFKDQYKIGFGPEWRVVLSKND